MAEIIELQIKEIEEDDTEILKPKKEKKPRTEKQLEQIANMQKARQSNIEKRKEEKLLSSAILIVEKAKKIPKEKKIPKAKKEIEIEKEPEIETEELKEEEYLESEPEEEIIEIKRKVKAPKVKEVKPVKEKVVKKKKRIVIELSESSDEEEEEEEEVPIPKRKMISQQNEKSQIKVHSKPLLNIFAD